MTNESKLFKLNGGADVEDTTHWIERTDKSLNGRLLFGTSKIPEIAGNFEEEHGGFKKEWKVLSWSWESGMEKEEDEEKEGAEKRK